MARIVVVGDGPAGLSAGLFLAKNGHDAVIFAGDETAMHYAELHNYLGIEKIGGTEFQRIARRQVLAQGADVRDEQVAEVSARDGGFAVRAGEAQVEADYVVLAGGKSSQSFAKELGATTDGGRVVVDGEYRTSVDRLYAVGRVARPERSQAIISAGAGATAAVDILSREAGRDFHDWDSPPDD